MDRTLSPGSVTEKTEIVKARDTGQTTKYYCITLRESEKAVDISHIP